MGESEIDRIVRERRARAARESARDAAVRTDQGQRLAAVARDFIGKTRPYGVSGGDWRRSWPGRDWHLATYPPGNPLDPSYANWRIPGRKGATTYTRCNYWLRQDGTWIEECATRTVWTWNPRPSGPDSPTERHPIGNPTDVVPAGDVPAMVNHITMTLAAFYDDLAAASASGDLQAHRRLAQEVEAFAEEQGATYLSIGEGAWGIKKVGFWRSTFWRADLDETGNTHFELVRTERTADSARRNIGQRGRVE